MRLSGVLVLCPMELQMLLISILSSFIQFFWSRIMLPFIVNILALVILHGVSWYLSEQELALDKD